MQTTISKSHLLFITCAVLLMVISVFPASAISDAEIQASVDKGVAWIASHQNAGGSWGTNNYVGITGFNVLKLEEYAWEQGIDPLSDDYIYNDQVEKGLAYLFSRVQTSGTHSGSIYYSTQCYETSIAIMAISASRHPEMDSGVPDGLGGTLTYKQVVEKAVDYLVRAQLQTGTFEGGWRYSLGSTSADNSVSGWVTLGLIYAKNLFDVPVPTTTLSKLDKWIDYIQYDANPANWQFGGSGYTAPGDSYTDSLKTGNLLFQCAMVGDTVATPRVQNALTFLSKNWDYNDYNRGWHYTPNGAIDYMTTFAMMKGFESLGIETLTVDGNPRNWYAEMATAIVSKQNADGSWPNDIYGNVYMTTPWALLTLEKTVEIPATFEVEKSVDKTVVDVGDTVTYTYLVKNTGFKEIYSIVLTDDELGIIAGPASGDDDNDGVLDPLEIWTYQVSTEIHVTTTNVATAEGEDGQANIITTTSNPVTVTIRGTPVPELPFIVPVMLLGAVFLLARYSRKE
jgi:hypothetical protein